MIITLAGNNNFSLQRSLSKLTKEFLAQENDLALEKLDGTDSSYEAILDAVQSVPFLASNKMVVVRELSSNKYAVEHIEQLIDSVSPTTKLVIVESLPDKRTSYYKLLKDKTTLEVHQQKEANELTKWLVEEAKNLNGTIGYSPAHYLIDRVGTDQAILFKELEKLVIYQPEITQETINLLTEKSPHSKIFDLLDATFAGNKSRALELYDQQKSQKVEPEAIMALLIWQLHLMALTKYGSDKSADQIAREAKLNAYPLQKAQGLSNKITSQKLSEMIDQLHQIDFKSKTTSISLDEALKTFIVTL